MPRPKRQKPPELSLPPGSDPEGLLALTLSHVEWMRVHNYSETTVRDRIQHLKYFAAWCADRGLTRPCEITRPILERYQRFLYHRRKANGQPLSFQSQYDRLSSVRGFFKYLTKTHRIPSNPAADLELPKIPRRLPKHVLTIPEVERVLMLPDVKEPLGLRDRAIMETFYSTGMRRKELAGLMVFDLDLERGTVLIREGKGQKQRMVPIGGAGAPLGREVPLRGPSGAGGGAGSGSALPHGLGRAAGSDVAHGHGAGLRGPGPARQARGLPPAAPHHGHADARGRGRRAAHPGDAGPCGPEDDADLHPGLDPQSQGDPHRHAPGGEAGEEGSPGPLPANNRGNISSWPRP
jgi:hypothetical protein